MRKFENRSLRAAMLPKLPCETLGYGLPLSFHFLQMRDEFKMNKPGLFGIQHSNRSFESKDAWGKNQFNSSFPAALASYIDALGLSNVYLKLDSNLKVVHDSISTTELYGISPESEDLFYSFESQFSPYQQLLIGSFPRIDLVTLNKQTGHCLRGLEIKLTAIPDNSTHDLPEDQYGCELVIRPDTIVYLACSIVSYYRDMPKVLGELIGDGFQAITDWRDGNNILACVNKMAEAIDRITRDSLDKQSPLVMQPIWKTLGKSPQLAEHCLDIFVWSDLAFIRLFLDVARSEINTLRRITRPVRTVVWLFKMLYDFSLNGQIEHTTIIDNLSYDTKNDKAFSINGRVTFPYMKCERLTKPIIKREQIKNIILGNGQNLLSPERRFDAIIFNSPQLFT